MRLSLQLLIGAMIFVVVGLALVPTVAASVAALDGIGLDAGTQSLVDLMTLLFVVLIVIGIVGAVAYNVRSKG